MYQPAQHLSSVSDDGRNYALPPPPPPPPISLPAQQSTMNIPRPPPRPAAQLNQYPSVILPPPPGPPPIQSSWGRSVDARGLQLPPLNSQNQAYNLGIYYSVPPPPSSEQMSATYIPGGDSFGPGVGIPAFTSRAENPETATSASMRTFEKPPFTPLDDGGSYYMSRDQLYMRHNRHDSQPPPDYNSIAHSVGSTVKPQTYSKGQPNPIPSIDAGLQWTMDRILVWLANNQFSKDWQETFKALNIHGSVFLELGTGQGGRGNFGMMHQHVYPQLAKECYKSGTGWDQGREREEGRRIRHLIKKIVTGRARNFSKTSHLRDDSLAGSAVGPIPDGMLEISPKIGRNIHSSTPSISNVEEESPMRSTLGNSEFGFTDRKLSDKSTNIPTLNKNNLLESESTYISQNRNSHRTVLKNIDNGSRHHSPTSSETDDGVFRGSGLRIDASPKSASPRPFSPFQNNGSLAASPRTSRFGHRASTSAESVSSNTAIYGSGIPAGASQLLLSSLGGGVGESSGARNQENRRQLIETTRLSPLESGERSASSDPANFAKETKGFLKHFRKRRKDDRAASSPEDLIPESPTSPLQFKVGSFLANGKISNASESSLDQPLSAVSFSENDRLTHTTAYRAKRNVLGRSFILATLDGWNYRMCEVTDADSAGELRSTLKDSLGLHHTDRVQVFLTELGKADHEEPLDDKKLMLYKRTKIDQPGSLKFFVKSDTNPNKLSASSRACPEMTSSIKFNNSHVLPSSIPINEEAFSTRDEVRPRSSSSPPTAGLNSGTPTGSGTAKATWEPSGDSLRDRIMMFRPPQTGGENHLPDSERQAFKELAASEHKAEMERLQKSYLAKKKASRESTTAADGTIGIVGRNVDFDQPRISPFENKRQENLLPQRKAPPPPPAESATLIKANSLSQRTRQLGTQPRTPRPSLDNDDKRFSGEGPSYTPQEMAEYGQNKSVTSSTLASGGIAAALVGMGNRLGGVTRSNPSVTPLSTENKSVPSATNTTELRRSAISSMGLTSGSSGRNSPKSVNSTPESTAWAREDGSNSPEYKDDANSDNDITLPLQMNVDITPPNHKRLSSSADRNLSSGSGGHHDSNIEHLRDRRSYGPKLEFTESNIDFKGSTQEKFQEESDDESDDGLFAVPISSRKPLKRSSMTDAIPSEEDANVGGNASQRPNLTISTPRLKKGLSVSFKSPEPSSGAMPMATSSRINDLDSHKSPRTDSKKLQRPHASSTISDSEADRIADIDEETDTKLQRRKSFAREDVWANRPPAEALIDHLDAFFPNLDLDQPVLEESSVNVDPLSPSQDPETYELDATSQPAMSMSEQPETNKNNSHLAHKEGEVIGSNQPTLKALERSETVQSVAQRNIRRSGGLARMKSIREVARGAHEASKRLTTPALPGGTLTTIQRRKSTKMFGANIVQIKPVRGSMILPRITQDTIPKRQTTFRWFKGQLIGKGTYGRVYLGMNATTGEFLAVKQVEVSSKAAGNDKEKMRDMVAALNQEIDTMQHLDHANIVQYLGCERKETSISIFLEYISGGSVGSCLRKHGKFEEIVVSSLTRQTLSGLAYLHREGILHRDLKADNILLDLDGSCKISDFGISKKTDNIYGNDATNSMQGTVFWMAPEVVRSHGQGYSAKVDIWSLGCVVLEMFAGRRPWSKEETVGAIYKLGSLNEAPPIPDDVAQSISPVAIAFMADCFTIDPSERPIADTLLSQHPFCKLNSNYNFFDTDLYSKIRGAY